MAIRTESRAIHNAFVSLESDQKLPAPNLPYTCDLVVRSGNDALTVCTELRSIHNPVSLENRQELAGLGIPHPRGFVVRSGNDALAIRTELRLIQTFSVPLENC